MKNPWIKKNPLLSMWMSGANAVFGAARSRATAEARRQAVTMMSEMTKAAWQSKRSDIEKLSPGITRSKFIYSLPRRKYEQGLKATRDFLDNNPIRFDAFLPELNYTASWVSML